MAIMHRFESPRVEASRRRRAALALTAGVAALAALLAACGGGEAEGGAPSATPTTVVTAIPTPTATPDTAATYLVRDGDTGLAIALRFGITLADLAQANNMTERELDVLAIGQQLRIPR